MEIKRKWKGLSAFGKKYYQLISGEKEKDTEE